MRLLFSEAQADYAHYVFPYAVWAFPEAGETPADLFGAGFLPSSRALDRFYLCRQVRVDLRRFRLSSENRRILRKGEGLTVRLVPRAEFDFTAARRDFCLRYAHRKFGPDTMPPVRLDSLFAGRITSHLLLFEDAAAAKEVGLATLFLQEPAMGYYYYAFYDLDYFARSLGLFMMTSAVARLAELGLAHLYLGSCYSQSALYKTQFAGVEFFNGTRWSANLEELKYLVKRGEAPVAEHLLESQEYHRLFGAGEVHALASASLFRGAAVS